MIFFEMNIVDTNIKSPQAYTCGDSWLYVYVFPLNIFNYAFLKFDPLSIAPLI